MREEIFTNDTTRLLTLIVESNFGLLKRLQNESALSRCGSVELGEKRLYLLAYLALVELGERLVLELGEEVLGKAAEVVDLLLFLTLVGTVL